MNEAERRINRQSLVGLSTRIFAACNNRFTIIAPSMGQFRNRRV